MGQAGGGLDLSSPWAARRLVGRRVYEAAAQAPRALYAAASKNNVVPAGRWRSGGGHHWLVRAADSGRGLQLRRAGAERRGWFWSFVAAVCALIFFRGHYPPLPERGRRLSGRVVSWGAGLGGSR